MKRVILITLFILLIMSLVIGCTKKEETPKETATDKELSEISSEIDEISLDEELNMTDLDLLEEDLNFEL